MSRAYSVDAADVAAPRPALAYGGGGRLRVSPYARITPKPMLEYNKVVCKYVLQLQWP